MLKWFLPAGAGVAQVELSAADTKLALHIKHFKPRRNCLLKKKNPVSSALNFVYLMKQLY